MVRYLVLILVLFSNFASAETSTDRAKMYFSDIENRNFTAAAEHFDPVQLKEFRKMMEFYKEIPPEAQKQFIQTFFGAEQTLESMETVTDTEFFSGLFSFIMKQADAAGGLSFDGIEILGEVKEGKHVSHLVTRNRVSVGELEMEAMEVISLKKVGDEWRVLMSGKIKGLPQQLKAAFNAQNN
jgi:hypothetical protein